MPNSAGRTAQKHAALDEKQEAYKPNTLALRAALAEQRKRTGRLKLVDYLPVSRRRVHVVSKQHSPWRLSEQMPHGYYQISRVLLV